MNTVNFSKYFLYLKRIAFNIFHHVRSLLLGFAYQLNFDFSYLWLQICYILLFWFIELFLDIFLDIFLDFELFFIQLILSCFLLLLLIFIWCQAW